MSRLVSILIVVFLAGCSEGNVSPGQMSHQQTDTTSASPTGPTTCINGATYEGVPWSDSKFLVTKDGKYVPC